LRSKGALKLKEISYIFTLRAIPAGEMKHGPNALIDENLPVVVAGNAGRIDPDAMTRLKKAFRHQEVKARDGIVFSIVTKAIISRAEASNTLSNCLRRRTPCAALEIFQLQLLAYHIAVRRGCDVEQRGILLSPSRSSNPDAVQRSVERFHYYRRFASSLDSRFSARMKEFSHFPSCVRTLFLILRRTCHSADAGYEHGDSSRAAC